MTPLAYKIHEYNTCATQSKNPLYHIRMCDIFPPHAASDMYKLDAILFMQVRVHISVCVYSMQHALSLRLSPCASTDGQDKS